MAKRKKLPPLKKWQQTAVKLKLYKTKEIRQFAKMSELSKEQQSQIRKQWYTERKTKEYKRRQYERKVGVNSIEINHNVNNSTITVIPEGEQKRQEITTFETFSPIRDKDLVDIKKYEDENGTFYNIIDKKTNEVVAKLKARMNPKTRTKEYYRVDENDNPYPYDDVVISDTLFNHFYLEKLLPEQFQSDKQEEPQESESIKTLGSLIEERVDELLEQIPNEVVKTGVSGLIKDITGKDFKWDKMSYDRNDILLKQLGSISSILMQANEMYIEKDLYNMLEASYQAITGKIVGTHGDTAHHLYEIAKKGADDVILMRAKAAGYTDVSEYKRQQRAMRKREELS